MYIFLPDETTARPSAAEASAKAERRQFVPGQKGLGNAPCSPRLCYVYVAATQKSQLMSLNVVNLEYKIVKVIYGVFAKKVIN